jgi:hypothetical protein
MNSIREIKTLLQNKLDKEAQDRENLIKSRIQQFNNRHRNVLGDSNSVAFDSGKNRTVWEK